MTEKTGVSTNNLVEEANYGEGKKLPQYVAALSGNQSKRHHPPF
jgi:hypothetical protein